MAPIPERAFRSLLGSLDGEAFADFVAALWSARGYDVERDGDRLVAAADDHREILYPVAARLGGRWRPPAAPDAEVTTVVLGDRTVPRWARDGDVVVVDADDLYGMVRYGISAGARERLFERHFDRSPEARPVDETRAAGLAHRLPGPLGGAVEAAAGAVGPRADAVAAVVVAVLFLVALLGGGGLLAGGGPFGGSTPDAGGPAPTATTTGSPSVAPLVDPTTPTPDAGPPTFPPGVNATGVGNASRLAVAHVETVGGTSYTLVLSYREVGPNHVGAAREVVRRESKTEYVTAVEHRGRFAGSHWPVAAVETYADGDRRYERYRRNRSVRYRATGVYEGRVGLVESHAAAVVTTALAGAETAVVESFERDGTTLYRVRFAGSDGVENASGTLLVDERGAVRFLRWTYERPDSDVRVAVVLQYVAFGETTVDPPAWYDEARNATW